jgi:hypothetical protein
VQVVLDRFDVLLEHLARQVIGQRLLGDEETLHSIEHLGIGHGCAGSGCCGGRRTHDGSSGGSPTGTAAAAFAALGAAFAAFLLAHARLLDVVQGQRVDC